MGDRCTDATDPGAELAGRDPETLVGPMLWLLTRLARGNDDTAVRRDLGRALAAHLAALAAHPGVAPELRLAAGVLAVEHRPRAAGPESHVAAE